MDGRKIQTSKPERVTRKWWFFMLFIFIQFIVPPYASKGFEWNQWGDVIMHSLRYAVIYSYPQIYPVFKIVPIVLITLLIIYKNRFRRWFNAYVAFSYFLFAFGQNIAVTEKYGLSICTINIIMFSAAAGFWIWEAIVLKNDFTCPKISFSRYWVVPLMLIAFWYPLNFVTARPDFNPLGIVTNVAGVTFCMMTPVYVGLLTLYLPKVNIAVLRMTSLVGLIIGLYNMYSNFGIRPDILWFNGVLHIPLIVISIYGLVLSFKKMPRIKIP
jgi:hypothetical protein